MTKNVSTMFTSLTDVITKEPNNDGKLNPFNGKWNTNYFEACDPITDGIISYFTFVFSLIFRCQRNNLLLLFVYLRWNSSCSCRRTFLYVLFSRCNKFSTNKNANGLRNSSIYLLFSIIKFTFFLFVFVNLRAH